MGKANGPCLPCSLICWFHISTYLNKSLPKTRPSLWCSRPLSSCRWLYPSFRSRAEHHLPKEAIPDYQSREEFPLPPPQARARRPVLLLHSTCHSMKLSYSFIVCPSISSTPNECQLPESQDPGCLVHYNILST